MKPVSPVIPEQNFPEIIIAENQPEYMPLPVILFDGGVILARWQLDEAEKIAVSNTGEIYINLLTFGKPPPQILFQVNCPVKISDEKEADTDEELKTEFDKSVYDGAALPVLESNPQGVWLLLKLTVKDRRQIASEGNIYFFMDTKGEPVTPSLLQVEKPDIQEIKVEFCTGVRASQKSQDMAKRHGIEIVRCSCVICNHEVLVSAQMNETIQKLAAKTICSVCAEDSAIEHTVLPETMEQFKKITEAADPNKEEITGRAMMYARDAAAVKFEMGMIEIYGLIGQLQLAFRHPQNTGPTREITEKFVRDLIVKIDPEREEVYQFLMMGFNEFCDE